MKTVVITGASSGIGKNCAEEFIQQGYSVWNISLNENIETSEYLKKLSNDQKVNYYESFIDITDDTACKETVREISKTVESVDVLVNNAGITDSSLFMMTSAKKLREVFDVNYFAPIMLSQLFSKIMMKSKSGSIINVASVTGVRPLDGALSYGSSKAALVYATQVMAKELGKYNIRVNAVCPGFVDTAMWKNRDEEAISDGIKKSALGRQGKPEEIAKTIVFLASEESSYVTGSVLVVDGGVRIV